MNKLVNVFIFVAGAATGSLVTWNMLKKYYEQKTNDDVESIKKIFDKKEAYYKEHVESSSDTAEPEQTSEPEPEPEITEEELSEYDAIITDYTSYSKKSDGKKESVLNKPHVTVISPDEFGEDEEYDQISLTYYNDGVLTDDANQVIIDVDDVVGYDSLNTFGEYEDDSVFVKNDKYKVYYEILLDMRDYEDVMRI